jgi:hypothetical protein
LRWRWSCWNKKSHFNNEVNLHMCQLFIYIYIDVWKSSQRMNLRDIGSETRLTILCKQTKMINKRLKCSTTSKKMLKYNKNNYKSTDYNYTQIDRYFTWPTSFISVSN